jgi:hypothetical protein
VNFKTASDVEGMYFIQMDYDEVKMNKPISSMSSSVFSTREAAKASAPFRPEPGKALSTEEVEKLVTNESDMVDYVEKLVSKNLDDVIGKVLGD